MGITVHEALELDILKGFKVIAGENGLSNEINHVAVWDYETGDLIKENFSPRDFALSTLVAIKDNIEELYNIVKIMIEVGISCLAVKDIYVKGIPKNVIELADKEHFPIMMFSDTFTEDVIVYVNKAISEKKKYENLASIIDNILYNDYNDMTIRKIAKNINVNFKEKNAAAYCMKKNNKQASIKNFTDKETEEVFSKVIPYKGGYILINTFEEGEEEGIDKIILRRLKWWGFDEKEYIIGVSSLYEDLGSLNKSIQESLYALRYARAYKKDISFFHQIGINRIILPILDDPWVLKYYNEIIEPLIEYDKKNETELLETAVKYVENNGDVKATAEELFQHGNTIRYRINRINRILSKNHKSEHFYEELALAIRIYVLRNSSL